MRCLNRNCLLNEKSKCLSEQVTKMKKECKSKNIKTVETEEKLKDIKVFRNNTNTRKSKK